MKRLLPILTVTLGTLACSLAGCGDGGSEVRAPLRGKITYQGKPVTMGRVTFSNAASGVHLTADIDRSGSYEVRSHRGSGIPPGTYQVAVIPPAENPKDKHAPPPACPDIPAKYRNPATSGLACTVAEGKENQYDIGMTGP